MPETKKIRVVLIDDHFSIHEMVSTLLRQTPDIALVGQGANGQDALELCERVQPDIVLMDVVMPIMDGIQLGFWSYPVSRITRACTPCSETELWAI